MRTQAGAGTFTVIVSRLSSIFGWKDDGLDAPGRASKLRTFQSILLLHVLTELWIGALNGPISGGGPETWFLRIALAFVSILVPIALLAPNARAPVFGALAAILSIELWILFPWSGNHIYLQTYLCFFSFLLCGKADEEQRLLLAVLRWLCVLVLFFAGVQKLVHGYYDHGEIYFTNDNLFPLVRALGSAEDVARLASRSEPFRVDSGALLALANLAWLGEVGLALLLAGKKTRALGAAGAIVLVVAIESMARELLFGAIYVNLLLLFFKRDLGRKQVAIFALFYLWLLLMTLGVVPKVRFT